MVEMRQPSELNAPADPNGLSVRAALGTMGVLLLLGYALPLSYARFVNWYVRRPPFSGPGLVSQWLLSLYPVTVAFFLLEMLAVILIYRQATTSYGSPKHDKTPPLVLLRSAFIGVGTGLAVTAVGYFVIARGPSARLLVGFILSCPLCAHTAVVMSILVFALPPVTEMVFRGIIMESLLRHRQPVVAAVAGSLVFALIWPAFGFWFGLILGIALSILYQSTRSLLTCTLANATATVTAGTLLLCRALRAL
jgi:membrane protease YdiL (CAAX protease family)